MLKEQEARHSYTYKGKVMVYQGVTVSYVLFSEKPQENMAAKTYCKSCSDKCASFKNDSCLWCYAFFAITIKLLVLV